MVWVTYMKGLISVGMILNLDSRNKTANSKTRLEIMVLWLEGMFGLIRTN